MEQLMLEALRRAQALAGLAQYADERAIFFRTAPADLEFEGGGYPYCVFDWLPAPATPRIGALMIDLVALDEGSFAPAVAADALRSELDGMAFGGATARALRWRGTGEFSGGDGARVPRITGATLEFEVYEFAAPMTGLEQALTQAAGALLGSGYADIRSAASTGERMTATPYCVQLTSLTRENAAAGYEYASFEAALRMPGGSRERAYEAQSRLGATGVMKLGDGGALLDSTRLTLNADGYAQAQLTLRGRVNALDMAQPGAMLENVYVNGAIKLDIDGVWADSRQGG